MWFWLSLSLTYYAGAVITYRQAVLQMLNRHGERWRKIHLRDPDIDVPRLFIVTVLVLFWPAVAFVLGSNKLAFPFGQKNWRERREARRKVREAREREAAQLRQEQYAAAVKFLDQMAADQMAIETATPTVAVMGRRVAEAEFTQWSDQVYRERGKPWKIGALERVRVRHQLAKEVANS